MDIMKRIFAAILVCLLLTGCVWNVNTPTTLPLTTPPITPTTTVTGSPAPVGCGGHESDP